MPHRPALRRPLQPLFALAAALSCSTLLALAAGCKRDTPQGFTGQDAGATATAQGAPLTVAWEPAARDAAIAEGKAVLARNECNRCHTIDDIKPAERSFHCVSCHVSLKALVPSDHAYQSLSKKYGEALLQRYQHNIQHLQRVPDLTAIARRVRPDWIASFLREPSDQRPALEESMIRHALSEGDIKAVVRYFAAVGQAPDPYAEGFKEPERSPRPDAARLEAGEKLFFAKGCVTCHTFGNLDTKVPASQLRASLAGQLAPNLRFARERVRPEAMVAWLQTPDKLLPGTLMPTLALGRDEAELLRDFLLYAEAPVAPAPEPPSLIVPPVLERAVSYEEMKERTLGKVCVHCHMNDYEKDHGPGNKGGFGYKGIGLAMRTYESLVNGAIDESGQRYSVLVPRPGEATPPILLAMMRRRAEEQRDHVEPFQDHALPRYPSKQLGMPLGLPAMSDEEMSILATWIAQGCPGPTKETGMAGVSDGYLIPDGPIAKNRGCELRAPESKRPSWAVDSKVIGTPEPAVAKK